MPGIRIWELTEALEATPIVVDGIMFFTSTWSRVYAVEAKTGETIWSFDPEVPGEWARKACCDIVNRGVGCLPRESILCQLRWKIVFTQR